MRQAATVFRGAISASRRFRHCSSAWRIDMATSSSTFRFSLHAWTIPLLTASEGILVTGVNTIPGLRQIAETLRAIREQFAVTADVRAVVNKCQFGVLGNVARADHVARVLGEAKRLLVRNTRVALECVDVGTPMTVAYPSDKSVRDIAAIAEYCLALKPHAPRRPQ